ncbi:hypothetical protein KIL84_017308 [Mauremys mutica]|uniref:Uncharacterized protein n=1 Tax=Mauremys mutica TaxID=74926 RepID=A0A9D3X0T5_9SAUR|nr:hypothetical protein KIL84_017308 [Mauremys mutica]
MGSMTNGAWGHQAWGGGALRGCSSWGRKGRPSGEAPRGFWGAPWVVGEAELWGRGHEPNGRGRVWGRRSWGAVWPGVLEVKQAGGGLGLTREPGGIGKRSGEEAGEILDLSP